ncbi:hypothetical protein L209DRAFT_748621 [Thermothelomyces heterothallicus CBS 203.75]
MRAVHAMLRRLCGLPVLFRHAGLLRSNHGRPAPIPIPELRRAFSTTAALKKKQLPPRPKPPPESEIEESFLKGSGPGGQKINKTNSAVQLKHIPTGIVVKSQATRSREQNRKIARQLLALKLDELVNGPQSRAAIVSEVKKKRAASRAKKARRKYRKLAAAQGKEGSKAEGAGEEEEQEAEEAEWEDMSEDREEEKEEVQAGTQAPPAPDSERGQAIERGNTKEDKV